MPQAGQHTPQEPAWRPPDEDVPENTADRPDSDLAPDMSVRQALAQAAETLGVGERVAMPSAYRTVAAVQGLYYMAQGLWPCIHPESFLQTFGLSTNILLAQSLGCVLI